MLTVAGCDFPDGLLYLVEHQTWARLDAADGSAVVGITALGIRQSGEIYMCRPKAVGSVVEQGRSIAVVELAKAIVAVKSPLGGTIVAINDALAATPELVHREPFGAGWIARLRPDDVARDRAALVADGDAVAAAMRRFAALNLLD